MAKCAFPDCEEQACAKRFVVTGELSGFIDVCHKCKDRIIKEEIKENDMEKVIEGLYSMANDKLKDAEILAAQRDYLGAYQASVEAQSCQAVAKMIKDGVFSK